MAEKAEEGWGLWGDIELGTILALLRMAAGWTEETLAEASGLSKRTISEIEQGSIVPGAQLSGEVAESPGLSLRGDGSGAGLHRDSSVLTEPRQSHGQ